MNPHLSGLIRQSQGWRCSQRLQPRRQFSRRGWKHRRISLRSSTFLIDGIRQGGLVNQRRCRSLSRLLLGDHRGSGDSQNASGKNSTCGDLTHNSEPFARTLGSFSYPAENGGHDVSRPMDDPDWNRHLGTQLVEGHVVQEHRVSLTQHHGGQQQLVP